MAASDQAVILSVGGYLDPSSILPYRFRESRKGIEMTSKNLLPIALVSAFMAYGTMAFAQAPASAPAKGTGTSQNHHCKQSDGTMDMSKTKKACLAEKGTWAKDGAAATAPSPAASAAPK